MKKIKEEKEHLKALKLSKTERLQKIISKEKEKIYPNFIDDDESLNNFIEKISNEIEIFTKNEMAQLEKLKRDEIKTLEKIKPEEI